MLIALFKKLWLIGCIACLPFCVLANDEYFMLTAPGGSSWEFYNIKYASGRLACEAAQAEDWREYQASLPDIHGTWTFIQWPDENVIPDLLHETDCIFSFTGSWTLPSPGFYDNSVHHWYVIAGMCADGQIFDTTTQQCEGGYFSKVSPPSNTQCGSICNGVRDPIDPVTGAMYDTETDMDSQSKTIGFGRLYNTTDGTASSISKGWRHSFSRSVKANNGVPLYSPYAANDPDNSSLYDDAASACTSGFAQVQSRTANWSGATASYLNGVCILTKSGVSIGILSIFFASPNLPTPSQSTVGYDVTRDDGQLIRFTIQNGQIVAPPSIGLKLQVVNNGYSIMDVGDNVEVYGADGKLQSITTRSGVTKTMSYDSSGRLSGVADNFGHRLILTYEGQNRLLSVESQ